MNIPKHILDFANSHGFNDMEEVRRTPEEIIYAVSIVDKDGIMLPSGLPHYIIDRAGNLQLVCDGDFHITDSL